MILTNIDQSLFFLSLCTFPVDQVGFKTNLLRLVFQTLLKKKKLTLGMDGLRSYVVYLERSVCVLQLTKMSVTEPSSTVEY